MAEQNIKMNVKTDTGYDTLYPQTKADIVSFNDTQSIVKGKTVQENLKNTANALYHPNLLINGDFQCWQRGTPYQTIVGYTTKYLADMWFTNNSNVKVSAVPNGGLKLEYSNDSEAWIKQKVDLEADKHYTCVYKINNNIKVKHFIGKQYFEDTKNIEYGSGGDLAIHIRPNDILKYVDLFEGDVAYPHVKEDYAIALNRCKRYIDRVSFTIPVINNVTNYYRFDIPKVSDPTVIEETNIYGVKGSDLKYHLSSDSRQGIARAFLTPTVVGYNQTVTDQAMTLITSMLLTCEPL